MAIVTEVQDLHSQIVKRIRNFTKEFEQALTDAFYDSEQNVNYKAVIDDFASQFSSYFYEGENIEDLGNEVKANLRTIDRDSKEFIYLKEIDTLFLQIDESMNRATNMVWQRFLLDRTNAFEKELNLKKPIDRLINEICLCCLSMQKSRDYAAKVSSTSFFVYKEPGEFNNIILFSNSRNASVPDLTVKNDTEELEDKRTRKKNPQLTTKQQMIMLDLLGFFNASILAKLTNEQKGAVLANLLNRSEQEIRSMITYWNGRAPKPAYDCKNPDDHDKVVDFLLAKNVAV